MQISSNRAMKLAVSVMANRGLMSLLTDDALNALNVTLDIRVRPDAPIAFPGDVDLAILREHPALELGLLVALNGSVDPFRTGVHPPASRKSASTSVPC